MDKKEAVRVLQVNHPCAECSLSQAFDVAIAAIEESVVQKPATNSESKQYITQGCRGCINRGTVCDSCEDFSNLEYA